MTSGIEYLFKKYGVDYYKGWGKFSSATGVQVDMNEGGTKDIVAKHSIIATGSEPTSLPAGLLDIDEKYVVSSTGALALEKIPKKMIVVGGGVIGLEMGSVYQRLGTDVQVINNSDRICPFLDAEVSKQFLRILKKQGLNFHLSTSLVSGKNNGDKGVSVVVKGPKGESTLDADVVLLSIGRRPFTGGLQLDKAGLQTDKFGRIEINKTW